jgi:hypothetical protein
MVRLGPAFAGVARFGRSRGALPRLRGRGEQGNIAWHALHFSTLFITPIELRTSTRLEERHPHLIAIGQSAARGRAFRDDVSLLTTASQARQRSTASPYADT